MTYEQLGQDDLSVRHGVAQGVHDAAADTVKYAILGTLALVVIAIAGRGRPSKIIRRLLPG